MFNKLYPDNNLRAWIDLSTYCNAGCPQCHRTNPHGLHKADWLPLVQWSLEQFKVAFPIEVLDQYSWFEFCGTWGDPVMNKDLDRIVRYVLRNSKKACVHINTNGSIRDAEWWWRLGVLGKERLHVWFDIDGIDQAMHSRYRQKTDFNKLKENVEAYTATGAVANAMTIVFMHNEDYLPQIKQLSREWGIQGEHLFIRSNRFFNRDTLVFETEDGSRDTLVQSTLEDDHPMLDE